MKTLAYMIAIFGAIAALVAAMWALVQLTTWLFGDSLWGLAFMMALITAAPAYNIARELAK